MNDHELDYYPDDPACAWQWIHIDTYNGSGHGRPGGGITIDMRTFAMAERLCDTLKRKPYHINRNGMRCCLDKRITRAEALKVDEDCPTLVHIETLGAETMKKVDAAMKHLFGCGIPAELYERKENGKAR
jgi:hypothetical protein